MIYENILELIGNTPVVKLNLEKDENIADVYVKLEKYNDRRCRKGRKITAWRNNS